MNTMDCRFQDYKQSLEGLQDTGIPLISKINGIYSASGMADDQGLSYVIPCIAKTFGLSIENSISIFNATVVIVASLISIGCFLFLCNQWYSRLIATIGLLCLGIFAYGYTDVYIIPYFAIASTIPLFFGYNQKIHLPLALAFSGLVIGYSNFIRAHSGTGVFLFLLCWVILNKSIFFPEKALFLFILSIFTALPYIHYAKLDRDRVHFLSSVYPQYQKTSFHPFWHSIYMGFSYVPRYISEYNDMVGWNKVHEINPNVIYCSKEHDQILKKEVLAIVKKDPGFILKSLRKKCRTLCKMTWPLGMVCALFFFFVPYKNRYFFPFLAALTFYALPGLLVLPVKVYCLGLYAIFALYAIYLSCLGIENFISRLKKYAPSVYH